MASETFEVNKQRTGTGDILSNDEWSFDPFQSKQLFSLNNLIEPSTELLIDSVTNLSFGEDDNYFSNDNHNYRMKKDIPVPISMSISVPIPIIDEGSIKEEPIKVDQIESIMENKQQVELSQEIQSSIILQSNVKEEEPILVNDLMSKSVVVLNNNEANDITTIKAIEEKEDLDSNIKQKDNNGRDNANDNEDYEEEKKLVNEIKEPISSKTQEAIEDKEVIEHEPTLVIKDNNDTKVNESNPNKTINELTEKIEKVQMKNNIIVDSNNKLLEIINVFKQMQSIDSKPAFNVRDLKEIKEAKLNQKNCKRSNSEGKIKLTPASPISPQSNKPKLYIDLMQTNNKSYAVIHGKENQKNADNTILQGKNLCRCRVYDNNAQESQANHHSKGVLNQMIYSYKRPLLRKQMSITTMNKPSYVSYSKKDNELGLGERNDCDNSNNNNSKWYNNTNSFQQIPYNKCGLVDIYSKKDYHQTLGQDSKQMRNTFDTNNNKQYYVNEMNKTNTIHYPNTSLDDYFNQTPNEIRRFTSFQWNHDNLLNKDNHDAESNNNPINQYDVLLSSPYCKIKPISLSNLTKKPNKVNDPSMNSMTMSTKNKSKYVDYKQFQVIFDDDNKANTNTDNKIYETRELNIITKEVSMSKTNSTTNTNTHTNTNSHMNTHHYNHMRAINNNANQLLPFYLLPKKDLIHNVVNALYEKPKKIVYHQRKPSKKSIEKSIR